MNPRSCAERIYGNQEIAPAPRRLADLMGDVIRTLGDTATFMDDGVPFSAASPPPPPEKLDSPANLLNSDNFIFGGAVSPTRRMGLTMTGPG